MDNRESILNGNLRKVLIRLAIPVVFINIISLIYGLTDAYWVGEMITRLLLQLHWLLLLLMYF